MDEIEKGTGLDFISDPPDDVKDRVEAGGGKRDVVVVGQGVSLIVLTVLF